MHLVHTAQLAALWCQYLPHRTLLEAKETQCTVLYKEVIIYTVFYIHYL